MKPVSFFNYNMLFKSLYLLDIKNIRKLGCIIDLSHITDLGEEVPRQTVRGPVFSERQISKLQHDKTHATEDGLPKDSSTLITTSS